MPLYILQPYTLRRLTRRFRFAQAGATAIEYALIASLIAMVILGAVTGLGESVQAMFNSTATAIQ